MRGAGPPGASDGAHLTHRVHAVHEAAPLPPDQVPRRTPPGAATECGHNTQCAQFSDKVFHFDLICHLKTFKLIQTYFYC
mgnify:CR=1 FL=1